MESYPAACAKADPSAVTEDSSSLSLVMQLRETRTGAVDDHGAAVSPILEDVGPDVTTDSILRELGIDPDVERAMDRIFTASSPSRNVNGETVTHDSVGLNREHPDTLAGSNNAENTQEGGVAGHNTAVSATNRSIFAIEDNAAGAALNGRSDASVSGLVLGPEPPLLSLPPFSAVPPFPFAASSSQVLPGLADASPMFKTVATVEYDELMRTKQMFEQQVQYISTGKPNFSFVS